MIADFEDYEFSAIDAVTTPALDTPDFDRVFDGYYQQFNEAGVPHFTSEYLAETVAEQTCYGIQPDPDDRRVLDAVYRDVFGTSLPDFR